MVIQNVNRGKETKDQEYRPHMISKTSASTKYSHRSGRNEKQAQAIIMNVTHGYALVAAIKNNKIKNNLFIALVIAVYTEMIPCTIMGKIDTINKYLILDNFLFYGTKTHHRSTTRNKK